MLWRHILGYLPVNAVQALVSFATVMLLTRLLDPADYGRYALVLVATQLVHMACFTWLHAGMARFFEGARLEGRLGPHFATAYAAYGAAAAIVALLYAGTVLLAGFDPQIRTALLFGLLMLLLRCALMMGLETHRAARQVGIFAGLEILHSLAALGLGVALILYTDLGAAGPFAGAAIAAAVCLAIDLPLILRMAERAAPSRAELRRFAAYGLPISLSLAIELVFQASDRVLIAAMLDEAAVGVYAAGYALAYRTMDILFVWLGTAAMPLVVAAFESDGVEAERAIARRNAETMVLVGFPAAAGLALVATPLSTVMLGAEFHGPAAEIIPWIALSGLMFGFTSHYVHTAFVLSRRTELMAAIMAVPAVANVGLNLLLIPRFGLTGAVIASVIAYALALALYAAVGRRLFPLPVPGAAILKGAAATAGMAVVVAAVPPLPGGVGLAAKVAAGVLAYAPLALLFDIAGCRGWIAAFGRRLALRSNP